MWKTIQDVRENYLRICATSENLFDKDHYIDWLEKRICQNDVAITKQDIEQTFLQYWR